MRNIVMKYESLVEDRQWNTKLKKDFEILTPTSQIQELEIIFSEQLKG